MEYIDIKHKLKLLIAYNIGEVLNIILSNINTEGKVTNDVILLFARYNDLNRDVNLKKIEREETLIEVNKLRLAILDFLDDLDSSDIQLENIGKILLEEGKFKEVIEMKIEKIQFIGMFESGTFKIEKLVFKWRDFFLSKNGVIKNIEHLEAAMNLIEVKKNLPITQFEKNEDKLVMYKIFNFLKLAKPLNMSAEPESIDLELINANGINKNEKSKIIEIFCSYVSRSV